MMWKRLAVAVVGLASIGMLTGCPAPASPHGVGAGGISCDGGTAQASALPGITTAPAIVTLSLVGPSTTARCVDRSGRGITSAQITGMSIAFPALSCFGGAGTSGAGSGTIGWSDGSTSDVDVAVAMDGVLTGTLSFSVTAGPLAGTHGSTDFVASPSAGDCTSGITAETVTISSLTLTS